jgi:catalase
MIEETLKLGREYPPEDEALLIEQVLIHSIASMKHKPHPPTPRDQHPKSHGYVEGEFIVEENIPDKFKIGIFSTPKTYPVWIRFSNGGSDRDRDGNFLPDTVGDVRGMAIKLTGVEGKMAVEDQDLTHQGEQDFVLMNSPIFFIRDIQGYINFFPIAKAMKEGKITFDSSGKPNDVPDELKVQFQAIAYALPILQSIRAKQTTSPLEIPYWSATPYKLGDHGIKFAVVPQITGKTFNPETADDPSHYLREAMIQHLASGDAYFDFKVQLQTDASKMPIEDPTVEWDEQESPYIKVAKIRIPQQDFNTNQRQKLDENQSFSPWHSLVEHKPLGGVNRARKIYTKLAKIRNEKNQGNE